MRGDQGQPVGASRQGAATASKVVVLSPAPESSRTPSSMVSTLERLAGRPGAEFMPKGTLRATVQRAAEAGDGEARALMESGALGDDSVER